MTLVDIPPRERRRRELAEVLGRDADDLIDDARLVGDLALDSLGMMRLLVWLERHGVSIDDDRHRDARVREILALLERTASPGLKVHVAGHGPAGSPTAVDLVASRAAASPLAPVLKTRTLLLAPIAGDDIDYLYALSVEPETCFRWRYRGAPPSIDRFVADLWTQVLVQFIARRSRDNRPVGHVVAYGADAAQRHAYVAALFGPQYAGTGVAAQSVAVFVRYLFHTYPLRKLYLEVPGFNWPQLRSGEGSLFRVEGILRDHDHYAGRSWDKYLCAIYPDAPALRDGAGA